MLTASATDMLALWIDFLRGEQLGVFVNCGGVGIGETQVKVQGG